MLKTSKNMCYKIYGVNYIEIEGEIVKYYFRNYFLTSGANVKIQNYPYKHIYQHFLG